MATISVGFLAPPATAAGHAITISTYSYHPGSLTIAAGDTVTWTNLDSVGHDVTVTRGPVLFHSPMLSQGQSWTYTFTVAGPYTYICSVHPDMTATLTVAPAPPGKVVEPQPRAHAATAVRPHATPSPVTHPQAAALPATESQAQMAPLDSATESTQINPLLLVGGALAGVLIFCLLIMASRPHPIAVTTVEAPEDDDTPTRVLPPPPPPA